jgi:hypothetical protein
MPPSSLPHNNQPAAALLRHADPLLLPAVLQIRPLVGGLLSSLASDPPPIALAALRLLRARALGAGAGVPARVQGGVWGDAALSQLAALCRAEDEEAEDGAEGAEAGRAEVEGYEELQAPHELAKGGVDGSSGSSSSESSSGSESSSSESESDAGSEEEEKEQPKEQPAEAPEPPQQTADKPAGPKRPPQVGGAGKEKAGSADMTSEAAQAAFDLLTCLLTDPAFGLAYAPAAPGGQQQRDGLTSGERRLLRLLQRLQPGASARHARLVRAAAEAQPRLAAQLLAALPFDLEPREDAKWLAAAAAVGALVRGAAAGPCPLLSRMEGGGGAAPGVDSAGVRGALRRCLPQAAPKALLSRGIQHSGRPVQQAMLGLLQACLAATQPYMGAAEARAAAAADAAAASSGAADHQQERSWVVFLRRLRTAVRSKLPDPSTLVALLAALDKTEVSASDKAAADRAAEQQQQRGVPSQVLLRHAVLRVLGWYARWLPEAVADAHLDVVSKLLGPEVSWR